MPDWKINLRGGEGGRDKVFGPMFTLYSTVYTFCPERLLKNVDTFLSLLHITLTNVWIQIDLG
jgi:hypothetical protein